MTGPRELPVVGHLRLASEPVISVAQIRPVAVSIPVAAELLGGVSADHVAEYVERTLRGEPGGLPVLKLGRRTLIPIAPLEECVAARTIWPSDVVRLDAAG